MRNSWKVAGLVLALLVASPPVRALAEISKAEKDAAVKKVKDAVKNDQFDDAREPLKKLLEDSLEEQARGKNLLTAAAAETDKDIKEALDKALDDGNYGLVAYYYDILDQRHQTPNIFGWALDLTVWSIIVFLILLFVLGRFAWKPMLAGLAKREKDIHAAVSDAQHAREEAQRLKEDIQAERDKMAAMHQETIDQARAEAQRVAEDTVAQAKAEAQAERDRLRREIETERAQAQRELFARVAELATLVSAKAIRRQMTEDDHRRLVDEALAELGPAADARQRGVTTN
jgi:F-type H+-transporting ATPase subunit b